MSLKIAANMSAVAYHIIDGAFTFPYAVDAHSAVARHPGEWSHEPWSVEATERAFQEAGTELEPLSAEEQAALDEHAKAVAEANARLKAFREEKAAEKAKAAQAAADEALVKSPGPQPVRRPFGRKGEPTAAELKMMRAKEHEDNLAAAEAKGAKVTR
jgi:hypothetical protein